MIDLREHCIQLLAKRGVSVADIADCAVYLQSAYFPNLKREDMVESVMDVLGKREVQYTIMTAIAIDKAADRGDIDDPILLNMLREDDGLYGVDEVLAYSICNVYGSIALTNFGYIDKDKFGIVGELNKKNPDGSYPGNHNTFLDDIVGAIAASAAARYAHSQEN